jgi:hypothetical protein
MTRQWHSRTLKLIVIGLVLSTAACTNSAQRIASTGEGVRTSDPPSAPLALSDPDGDYVLILTDVRDYQGHRWEQYYSEHYPGPGMMFVYPDIILKNSTDNDVAFVPVTQFWLEDGAGRTFDFSIGFAILEEYQRWVSIPDDPLGEPTITLPAQSEMPIYFETEIFKNSRDIVMVFDPDLTQVGDEVSVAFPR